MILFSISKVIKQSANPVKTKYQISLVTFRHIPPPPSIKKKLKNKHIWFIYSIHVALYCLFPVGMFNDSVHRNVLQVVTCTSSAI